MINYFLVHKIEVKNPISSTQVNNVSQVVNEVCLSLMKSPWHNPKSKEHRIKTNLMHTIISIQNIEHSYIVVSRN